MKWTVKAVSFLLIGAILFYVVQLVLSRNNYTGRYHSWVSLSKTEDINILIMGNSHAASGIRALDLQADLQEITGENILAFNYSPSGARTEHIYFLLKELFRVHEPDLVILETYAFCPIKEQDRDVLAHWSFGELPLNSNKVEAIEYCVNDKKIGLYIPMVRMHNQWRYMTWKDYDLYSLFRTLTIKENVWNGSGAVTCVEDPGDGWFRREVPAEDDLKPISEREKECLEKILALLKEKDIPLLLVSLPFKNQMHDSMTQVRINNYLRENYVDGEMVRLLDMNRMWDEMEFGYDDLIDEGHVNQQGSEKSTAVLLEYLTENYDIAGIVQ